MSSLLVNFWEERKKRKKKPSNNCLLFEGFFYELKSHQVILRSQIFLWTENRKLAIALLFQYN